MRQAARQLDCTEARCETCSAPVVVLPTGRPRKFCSGRCRAKACRSRHVVAWLMAIERINAEMRNEDLIDWSDEDHRVV